MGSFLVSGKVYVLLNSISYTHKLETTVLFMPRIHPLVFLSFMLSSCLKIIKIGKKEDKVL